MSRVEITELAQADLLEAWSYIAIENMGAADHVLDVIAKEADSLSWQPLMGRARPELFDGLRYWPTSVAYNLYYLPSDSGIVVIRILHQSRDVQSSEFLGLQERH
jgi:toxin ParE1/3/4